MAGEVLSDCCQIVKGVEKGSGMAANDGKMTKHRSASVCELHRRSGVLSDTGQYFRLCLKTDFLMGFRTKKSKSMHLRV